MHISLNLWDWQLKMNAGRETQNLFNVLCFPFHDVIRG